MKLLMKLVICLVCFAVSVFCCGCESTAISQTGHSNSAIASPTKMSNIAGATNNTTVPAISVREAQLLIQNNQDNPHFVILDVRTPDEFNSEHLSKAINIDFYSPDFKSEVSKLERSKEYLIYCRTGIRGEAATRIMLEMSFSRVHNLTGGIVEWMAEGHEVMR
jgi:rhodanese-related sulfurtransferase